MGNDLIHCQFSQPKVERGEALERLIDDRTKAVLGYFDLSDGAPAPA